MASLQDAGVVECAKVMFPFIDDDRAVITSGVAPGTLPRWKRPFSQLPDLSCPNSGIHFVSLCN